MTTHKSGFACHCWRTTLVNPLLNRVVGQKIAIMSDRKHKRPEIKSKGFTQHQMHKSFLSIHLESIKSQNIGGNFMGEASIIALRESRCLTVFMISAIKSGKATTSVIEQLRKNETPVFLVINKIDKVHPDNFVSKIMRLK